PQDYLTLIERRFANPEIRDTTRRVAFDGSSRHTGFVLPILRDALDAGGSVEGLSLVEALWARMCAAEREDGSRIEANDPQWETLVEAARKARTAPAKWLDQPAIYGTLADVPTFSATFARWLTLIWDEGTAAALDTYLSGKKTA
ncbi:MAG: mannitol dehydrogenase family protein, partial [Pseudomonadota bacterium]